MKISLQIVKKDDEIFVETVYDEVFLCGSGKTVHEALLDFAEEFSGKEGCLNEEEQRLEE